MSQISEITETSRKPRIQLFGRMYQPCFADELAKAQKSKIEMKPGFELEI